MTEQKDPLVLSCIDGSRFSGAVCDYSAWIASRASAPIKLLHNIERVTTPAVADLTGSIGLGSQEELLEELTSLEQQRSKLLLEQGRQMLEGAQERALKISNLFMLGLVALILGGVGFWYQTKGHRLFEEHQNSKRQPFMLNYLD